LQAATAPPPLPKQWDAIDKANGNKVFVLLDDQKDEEELTGVKEHWEATEGCGEIVTVHRVQNEKQWRRFHKAGKRLFSAGKHAQLNVIAYHGTRANVPWLICESNKGFDPNKGEAAPGSVSAAVFAPAEAAETPSSFCLSAVC
jgi:hypothetical protein